MNLGAVTAMSRVLLAFIDSEEDEIERLLLIFWQPFQMLITCRYRTAAREFILMLTAADERRNVGERAWVSLGSMIGSNHKAKTIYLIQKLNLICRGSNFLFKFMIFFYSI